MCFKTHHWKCLQVSSRPYSVCSRVTSRLNYVNALLYSLSLSFLCRLQRIKNTAARFITWTKKYDNKIPVFNSLQWLSGKFRIQFKLLATVFEALHGMLPSYIHNLTKQYEDRRFDVDAAALWNGSPANSKHENICAIFVVDLHHVF